MAFVEDFSLFLRESEFSVQATATTQFGELVQFQVIFDNGYQAFINGYAEGTQPSCLAASVDVADLVHESPIDIATDAVGGFDTWKVVEIQPDGTGMSTLRLRKP
jgi:hypothetical protein